MNYVLLYSLPSITGGLVVLDNSRGPVRVIIMAPSGAVITMDIMQIVIMVSAYSMSLESGVPSPSFRTSSNATGPRAACGNFHLYKK